MRPVFAPVLAPALAVGAAALLSSAAIAQSVSYSAPTFDRWNYPFNGTPGTRDVASTFSSGFIPGAFDDRDAQYLIAFVTAGDIQTGRTASDYIITSARVTATIDPRFAGVFAYDGTKDAVNTHYEPFQPGFAPDTDAGRPIELFATGYRNGFNAFSYNESGPFGFGDPTAEGIRNAYAADFDENGNLRDVSNNVRDQFETNSLAVGTVDGLAQGDSVAGDTTFSFEIDLSSDAIQAYLAQSLSDGIVSFSLSSLHVASQGGPSEFPGFYTNDSLFPGAFTPTLELTVEVVPSPAPLAALAGLGFLAGNRRRR